jgi:inhibitor of cysteine peptidase
MRTLFCLGLIAALVLVNAVGADKPASEPAKIAFTEDNFRQDGAAHKEKEVTLAAGEKLSVSLGSNGTTGYSWNEKAVNSDTNVVKQLSHERITPQTRMVGAGGTEVWTFEAVKAGNAILDFSYGRPWQGGEKGTWTLKVTVKVK